MTAPAGQSYALAQSAAARLAGNGVEERGAAANALATLALVEETRALREAQETANLIALYSMDDGARQGMVDGAGMTGNNWVDVTKRIKERLGL